MLPSISKLLDQRPSSAGPARLLGCVVAAVVLLAGACASNDDPTSEGQVADAYGHVIRWFVERRASEADQQLVFVEALGEGVGIALDTQAAIVESTQSFADVRFIDDRSEALDADGVRDDGILLALGPAVVDGNSAVIECDEVQSETALISRSFDLRHVGDEWSLRGDPTILPS
jgi:hypothetical protein